MSNLVLAFGELVWDVFPDCKILGGAPANLVFRLNSFGHEANLLTRVGDDEAGDEAIKKVESLGVEIGNIQRDNVFPTGKVKVQIVDEGQAEYIIQKDVAFDHIELSTEVLELIEKTKCICFGTLVQRYGISKNTLREIIHEAPRSLKFLDLKLRKDCYNKSIIETSLQYADILRLKENEVFSLKKELGLSEQSTIEISKHLLKEYKIDLVLVTRGKYGSFALDSKGNYFEEKGYLIDLVDTVGSGVAFSAGFLHYYLSGRSVVEALKFGNATGALVSSTMGATTPVSKKDILKLIKSGERREMGN